MPAVPGFIQNEICGPQVTEINECLQSGLFNGLLPFFLLFYVLKLYLQGFFVSLETAFYAKKGLFYAHVLPEDGISCKTAAILRCVVKNEELVATSSTVHGMVLVPRQPDQGAGHSHHRPPPPHVLGFSSWGYGGEKGG